MSLKELENDENDEYADQLVCIEITPYKKIHCYGVGFLLIESMKKPHKLAYSVNIEKNKLDSL